MMIKKIVLLISFIIPLLQFAQDYSGSWKGYFSYYEIKNVVKGGTKIYAASENAIFTYDTQTLEYEEITTVNGLSGESISTIYYSEDYELLLVGYESGLIEVVFDNDDDVLSVVDILGKAIINEADKRINHFNVYENLVYVSTNYGISVFNLERLEFGDTYFIGNSGSQIKVNQTAIFEGNIYAACYDGGGIRKAELNSPNLIDFRNWQSISSGYFLSVEASLANLYTIDSNRNIYSINNNTLNQLYTYSNTPEELKFSEDQLIVSTSSEVFIYNSGFDLLAAIPVSAEFSTQFKSSAVESEFIYIATNDFGILKSPILNPVNFEELHPSCPLLNKPFSISAQSNNLWVTYGEHTLSLNPYPLNNRGYSRFVENKWINTPYEEVLGAKCLKEININPFNTNQVFIGSYFSGLLEVIDGVPSVLYNETNSGLKSLIDETDPNYVDIRVGATSFDRNGVLWTLSNKTEEALKSFNPSNNRWESYGLSEILTSAFTTNGFHDLVIDSNETKWIATDNRGIIALNENGGGKLIKGLESEEDNMPSKRVLALAIDNRDQLWIGTNAGLRVIYNTSSFFTDETAVANEIIIEEDEIAKELLYQQFVSDILVDGANNKWVGTLGAGLFYFSSDGQKTIFHFTKTNSALPSNEIIELSLDESTGILYVATEKGLVSFSSGGSGTVEGFDSAYVYPNPVRPSFNMVDEKIKIKDLPENVNIKITDIEGNLVAEAQSKTNQRYEGYNLEIDGGIALWNGKNLANNIVASGVYLVMLSDLDSFETKVLKLMVVR